MSIERTRTCHRCQRENRREDKFCSQCGADIDGLNDDQVLISAGLTIAPFIIIPILLAWYFDYSETEGYESFGFAYIAVAMFVTILWAACAAGLAIVWLSVHSINRSVARGILIGIGAGLLLGVASCRGSFAVFYGI